MTTEYWITINYGETPYGHIILEKPAQDLLSTGMYCLVPSLIRWPDGHFEIADMSIVEIGVVTSIAEIFKEKELAQRSHSPQD